MTKLSRRHWFFLLLAMSLALWWRPLADTFRLALAHEEYTHILLVLPLTLALVYSGRREFLGIAHSSIRLGIWQLFGALLIEVLARGRWTGLSSDERLSLSMFALVIWWVGSIICCYGSRFVRSSLFSLCLLFFIVPLPVFALNGIIQFLQYQSASSAQVMFRAIGTPVTQDGVMLSIPGLDIEVAPQCSSIRSSMMLMVTTIVLAQSFLCTWWRKVVLILTAVPLSFLKNGLRIFVLGEIGTRIDPGIFDGRLHHHGGIVFLSAAIIVVVLLLWGLRHFELSRREGPKLSTIVG